MEMVVMEIDSRFKAIDIRYGSFNSNNNGVVTSSSTNDRPTQYVPAEQVYHYWKNKNRLICDSSCTAACHNNNSIRAENFTMPACSLKDLYRVWLFGDNRTMIGPLKCLKKEFRNDLSDSSSPHKLKTSNVNYLNKATMIISIFEKFIRQVCGNQAITPDTFEDMFDRAYDPFYSSLYQDARGNNNWTSVSYSALCNRYSKNKPASSKVIRKVKSKK